MMRSRPEPATERKIPYARGVLMLSVAGFVFILGAALAARAADTGTLTVDVTGPESERGNVLIKLANSRADYDDGAEGFRRGAVKPAGGTTRIVFEKVPYGAYAVKLFHDENDNRDLDVGLMGPKERYGLSNDARGTFGAPAFEAARFRLDAPTLTIVIHTK